jgi:hypothetical protein
MDDMVQQSVETCMIILESVPLREAVLAIEEVAAAVILVVAVFVVVH